MKRHSRVHVRVQSRKHKAKVRRVIRSTWLHPNDEYNFIEPDGSYSLLSDSTVGRQASVHLCGCSCPHCGNPRKFYRDLTMQEKKDIEATKLEEQDLTSEAA